MPPETGATAPRITLPSLTGERFDSAHAGSTVVLAFFKVECPTCQYAFPFLDRLHRAYAGKSFRVVGVSQSDKASTVAFNRDFGVSFPVLLDDPKGYAASNAYGLVYVPSIFLVSPQGRMEQATIGWVKPEFEELNRKSAAAAGKPPVALFKPGEQVVEFKAG